MLASHVRAALTYATRLPFGALAAHKRSAARGGAYFRVERRVRVRTAASARTGKWGDDE